LLHYFFAIILLFSYSCKKEDDKEMKYAKAKIKLGNDSAGLNLTESTGAPDSLKIIILYARIKEQVDNDGTGEKSSFIYINHDCAKTEYELTAEQEEAGEGATIGDSDIDGCAHQDDSWKSGDKTMEVTKVAETAVDMAEGSEAVNAVLNAQQRNVELGDSENPNVTYRQLDIAYRVETHTDDPNVTWSFAETGVEDEGFVWAFNEIAIELDPPLELTEGDRVEITLSYSLDEAVHYGSDVDLTERGIDNLVEGDSFADDCVGTQGDADFTCLVIPDFSPTVEKL